MIDVSKTILAKSDQMNADDFAGPMTIKITEVREGSGQDQPIIIKFEGDNGKPFKPCKTVRRILVRAWGKNGQDYVGRSMTVFNDPQVKWGGEPVGGVRVSHLSHIDSDMTMPLTVTRGVKKPYTVKKLVTQQPDTPDPEAIIRAIQTAEDFAAQGSDVYKKWYMSEQGQPVRNLFKDDPKVMDNMKTLCMEADARDHPQGSGESHVDDDQFNRDFGGGDYDQG